MMSDFCPFKCNMKGFYFQFEYPGIRKYLQKNTQRFEYFQIE